MMGDNYYPCVFVCEFGKFNKAALATDFHETGIFQTVFDFAEMQ